MRLGRLRLGEWLAGLSAVALLVVLFVNWFSLGTDHGRPVVIVGSGPGSVDGLSSLGWFAVLVVLLAIAAGLALAIVTAMPSRSPSLSVAMNVVATTLGVLATIAVLARLVFQPGLGVGAPNRVVDVEIGAWLGLLFALGIAVGGWLAMKDEHPPAGEGYEGPVETRPIPPAA